MSTAYPFPLNPLLRFASLREIAPQRFFAGVAHPGAPPDPLRASPVDFPISLSADPRLA